MKGTTKRGRSVSKKKTARLAYEKEHANFGAHDWHGDPATEKQLLYLKGLGAQIGGALTKGQAHDLIQQFLEVVGQLSPKQIACLHYHGFNPVKLTLAEAWHDLDVIHNDPSQFQVSEPWETAKYRLYPQLYGTAPGSRKRVGCALTLILAAIVVLVWLYASLNK